MKKLISMMLAVTMIVSMLCFGASAADDLVGKYNAADKAGDYTDGSATLVQNSGSGAYDVVFQVTGSTTNRYAVDIEASNLLFVFSTGLVWDVNTLDYVAADGTTVTAPDSPTFVVSNRSDMPVKIALADAESTAGLAAGIALDFAKKSMTLSACTPGATAPVAETFTGTWTCSDWAAAMGILKTHVDAEDKVVVATVTFTVSMPTA